MNPAIEEFVRSKRLAVVGVSRSGKKFGNIVTTELKQRGYQVFVIHPEAKEIAGDLCYPSLSAVQEQVDGVVISVSPTNALKAVREAAEAGIKKIWLTQGAESPEVLSLASELGVTVITGKCILMYALPVTGFHGVHRVFARIFGQL